MTDLTVEIGKQSPLRDTQTRNEISHYLLNPRKNQNLEDNLQMQKNQTSTKKHRESRDQQKKEEGLDLRKKEDDPDLCRDRQRDVLHLWYQRKNLDLQKGEGSRDQSLTNLKGNPNDLDRDPTTLSTSPNDPDLGLNASRGLEVGLLLLLEHENPDQILQINTVNENLVLNLQTNEKERTGPNPQRLVEKEIILQKKTRKQGTGLKIEKMRIDQTPKMTIQQRNECKDMKKNMKSYLKN